jgi:hypothetical protein
MLKKKKFLPPSDLFEKGGGLGNYRFLLCNDLHDLIDLAREASVDIDFSMFGGGFCCPEIVVSKSAITESLCSKLRELFATKK